MDEERLKKINAVKEKAALKAFEAYAAVLEDDLGQEGLAEALDATSHSHDAFLMLPGKPLYVRCKWDFSCHPAVIAAAAERALAEAEAAKEQEPPP